MEEVHTQYYILNKITAYLVFEHIDNRIENGEFVTINDLYYKSLLSNTNDTIQMQVTKNHHNTGLSYHCWVLPFLSHAAAQF